jgi:hypothetical protein
MKRFNVLLASFVLAISLNAQSDAQKPSEEIQTIFGKSGQPKVGWFIGLDQGYTKFDEKDVWQGGLNFGMIIDHQLSLGLAGYGWCNHDRLHFADLTETEGAYLEGGYGGVLLEYTLFPTSPVHITFPVLIGGGGVTYISDQGLPEWDEDEWDTDYDVLDYDVFFVIEPGVRAEINLLKFMKLNAGVSYRYADGVQLINTSGDIFNNFNATVGLKFGKF